MCRDLSCLFTREGRLIESFANTSSHEDLVEWCGLPDNRETFVRIEFTPPEDPEKIEDPSAWNLIVDESSTPEWLNEERARREIWGIVQGMLVRDERTILMGGCWIVLPSARIQKMAHGKIVWARRADLRRADLRRANLSGANLSGANLSGEDLTGAIGLPKKE